MSSSSRKDQAQREHATTFRRAGRQAAPTEYEIQQKAFWKNYERLKAERLAREAAKPKEK